MREIQPSEVGRWAKPIQATGYPAPEIGFMVTIRARNPVPTTDMLVQAMQANSPYNQETMAQARDILGALRAQQTGLLLNGGVVVFATGGYPQETKQNTLASIPIAY